MDIKNKVKYSFLIIVLLILLIFTANSIILYQVKENEQSKVNISKLILLQENMTFLTKDIVLASSKDELISIENKFKKIELEFESLYNEIKNDKEKDFVDYFLKDMHQADTVLKQMNTLTKNEKQIEKSFDEIFKIQYEKIQLQNQFNKIYPQENNLRKKIEHEILERKSFILLLDFANIKYYSKEVLFQKQTEDYLQKWLLSIDSLYEKLNINLIQNYKNNVKKIGNIAIKIKENINNEAILQNKIFEFLNINKTINTNIQKDIDKTSEEFINTIKNFISFLLLITLIFIIYLAIKVNKNVALSVDQIQQKVDKGLKEIKNLNEEIEETQKEVIFTMAAIGESRSKETGNHVKRVAEYTKLLALHYGLDPNEAEMLKQASPMHDIGKVAIPDAILNKPGRFDEEERKIMNTHAALGYEMLKHSKRPLLKMAATISNEHHEKWDGSGYPRGLKGENIHIYGRITALADVFDALGSDRCYKKAWDDDRIFKLFKEEKGKHFDPKLIDIFFDNLNEFLKIREKFKDTYN